MGKVASLLPTIKCSTCAQEIDISLMGDHLCKGPSSHGSAGTSAKRTSPYSSPGRYKTRDSRSPPIVARYSHRGQTSSASASDSSFYSDSPLTPRDNDPIYTGAYETNESYFERPKSRHNLDCAYPPFPAARPQKDKRPFDPDDNIYSLNKHSHVESTKHVLQKLDTITPGPFGNKVARASPAYEAPHMAQRPDMSRPVMPNPLRGPESPRKAQGQRPCRPPRPDDPPYLSAPSSPLRADMHPFPQRQARPSHDTSAKLGPNNDVHHPSYAPPSSPLRNEHFHEESSHYARPKEQRGLQSIQEYCGRGEVGRARPATAESPGRSFPNSKSDKHLIEWARKDERLNRAKMEEPPSLSERQLGAPFRLHKYEMSTSTTSGSSIRDELRPGTSYSSPARSDNIAASRNTPVSRKQSNGRHKDDAFDGLLSDISSSMEKLIHGSLPARSAIRTAELDRGLAWSSERKSKYCRACKQGIEGKALQSSDGALSGKWHRHCFNCRTCHRPLDSQFYVFEDWPYCARHYHRLNNTLCRACDEGIEGKALCTEKEERYHLSCFTCRTCNEQLRADYFEVDGRNYCHRHAQHLVDSNRYQKYERRQTRILQLGNRRL